MHTSLVSTVLLVIIKQFKNKDNNEHLTLERYFKFHKHKHEHEHKHFTFYVSVTGDRTDLTAVVSKVSLDICPCFRFFF